MFITSFIPLWISVVFLDILSLIRSTDNHYTEIISLVVITISLGFSIYIIWGSMRNVTPTDFSNYTIINVSQEKGITSEFLLSYILPLFAFNFTEWTGVVQFLIYFVVLAFLCIRNNNVYANLIFELRKYKFYSCELKPTSEAEALSSQVVVISKDNLCAKQMNTVCVAALNKPFFISK